MVRDGSFLADDVVVEDWDDSGGSSDRVDSRGSLGDGGEGSINNPS